MAVGETLTVEMRGGSPWGFRLYGGNGDPLLIAKLRKRSKASEAGLREGDVLLGINQYSCQSITHSVAMGLVDASGQVLTFNVLRGVTDKMAIDAAFAALGCKLQPVTASAMPQESQPSPPRQSYQPQPEQQVIQVQMRESPRAREMQPGYNSPGNQSNVSRHSETLTDGPTTKHITTETRTDQIGNSTITKTTRHEVSNTTYGSDIPVGTDKPLFNVTSVSAVKKPGVWTPSGGSVPKPISVDTPGVQLHQNADDSVTMTIGMQSHDKVASPPMFKVSKVTTEQPKGLWQPSSAAPYAPPQPQPVPPQPMYQTQPQSQYQAQPQSQYQPPPQSQYQPQPEHELHPGWRHPDEDHSQMRGSRSPQVPSPVPLLLTKVLTEGSGSDSAPDSPSALFIHRHRKLFGDSAFYDDPEHKYPTIEEQIKMARKVARSLTAPANTRARGHRMFVKRQLKSSKWISGMGTEPDLQFESESDEEETYYNPDPWSISHTWQPKPAPAPVHAHAHTHAHAPPKWDVPPVAPPVPVGLWSAPLFPYRADTLEKSKALSAEEIERLRLYEKKSTHTNVSPQICFNLAEDLRKMKGKGGRLFAKRRAKSEQWVVDETPTQCPAPNPALLNKIIIEGGHQPEERQPVIASGKPQQNRLKQMVDPPKAKMSPWDAAAEFGHVNPAFDHLHGYFQEKSGALQNKVAHNIQQAVREQEKSTFEPIPMKNAVMPEGSTKIKGWGGNDSVSSSGGFKPVGGFSPVGSSYSASSGAASGAMPPADSQPAKAPSGFRSVNFGGVGSAPGSGTSSFIKSFSSGAEFGGAEDVKDYSDL